MISSAHLKGSRSIVGCSGSAPSSVVLARAPSSVVLARAPSSVVLGLALHLFRRRASLSGEPSSSLSPATRFLGGFGRRTWPVLQHHVADDGHPPPGLRIGPGAAHALGHELLAEQTHLQLAFGNLDRHRLAA